MPEHPLASHQFKREDPPPTPLRDYLKILRKHWWLMTATFIVVVVAMAIWTLNQVPIYRASALVLIEPEPPKVLSNIQDVMSIAPTFEYYNTQYEMIKTRPVLERVIDRLNLKERIPGLASSATPHRALLGSVIVEPKRNTHLVFIHFENPNPTLAAEIANALAESYTRNNLDMKVQGAHDAQGWLNDQMKALGAKVQESAAALQNFRIKAGMVGLQEQRQIAAQKIMDFNKAHLDAQANRLAHESKLKELRQIVTDKSSATSIFTVADSPLIQKLKAELADLEAQKSKLLKVYKSQHPEVLKITAQTEQTSQRLDAELQTMLHAVQTEYKVAKAREDTMLEKVKQIQREGQEMNAKEAEYLSLQRENETNQFLYTEILKRLKETGITSAIQTNNVQVVEQAVVPTVPIRPDKRRSLTVSIIAGIALAVAGAFTLEYFDRNTVRTAMDVERRLGLPVIAIVPAFEGKRR
jgi:succinoglycan biosynthesis transport protein ExoP